jgi:hypothetical protein
MGYNYDILKNLIVEKEPTIKLEDIMIENVMNISLFSSRPSILIEFYTKIVKDIHGMKREFTKQQNHTFTLDEYNQRLKQSIREDKLNDLGLT